MLESAGPAPEAETWMTDERGAEVTVSGRSAILLRTVRAGLLTLAGVLAAYLALSQALAVCLFAMLIYIPIGYWFDSWMYRRFKPKQ